MDICRSIYNVIREHLDEILALRSTGTLKPDNSFVSKGDLLLTMYTERPEMNALVPSVLNYFDFSDEPVKVPSIVEELISYNKEKGEFVIEKE